ncbi:heme NO-binding domain-containing protein [Haloferula sp.]|uniref:heme NO-binding domain-containing protein n=1 Tax=Haloferula sp. TaxID=2497595 RepID=UPI00329FB19D
MKGIIFTHFIQMVEEAHGIRTVDRIIELSDLPSGGSYTAVGTYDHTEIVKLVTNLSEETSTEVPELLRQFGKYLFGHLAKSYPQFVEGVGNPLDFLGRIEGYIHVEVRKLYPDAELPRFECRRNSPNELVMIYQSIRHFEDLCEGLIRGSLDHFGAKATIGRRQLDDEREEFLITLDA